MYVGNEYIQRLNDERMDNELMSDLFMTHDTAAKPGGV